MGQFEIRFPGLMPGLSGRSYRALTHLLCPTLAFQIIAALDDGRLSFLCSGLLPARLGWCSTGTSKLAGQG
jgi:hypothetical protein